MTEQNDQAPIPRAMSATPLPPPPAPPPEMMDFANKTLDKIIDTEFLMKLGSPETVAATQAREAKQRATDWPALAQFRAANAALTATPDLVMMGDSITAMWQLAQPDLFGDTIVNRGISGQTSQQMLVRFMPDVVDLKPRRVHLLCGTNDIGGNTGPNTPDDYKRNVRAMLDLAAAAGIDVLLGSITPAAAIGWSPDATPQLWIPQLNDWLAELAAQRNAIFIDYHAALRDEAGGLSEPYSSDGVHLSRQGYRVMRELFDAALAGV